MCPVGQWLCTRICTSFRCHCNPPCGLHAHLPTLRGRYRYGGVNTRPVSLRHKTALSLKPSARIYIVLSCDRLLQNGGNIDRLFILCNRVRCEYLVLCVIIIVIIVVIGVIIIYSSSLNSDSVSNAQLRPYNQCRIKHCEAPSNFKVRGLFQNKTDPFYILLVS